jgi:hypothetical protein
MPEALVLDSSALARLQQGIDFEVDWLEHFNFAPPQTRIARVPLDAIVYLLGPDADSGSQVLVVNLADSGLFMSLNARHRPEAFLRLIRAARSAHEPGLPIPTSWCPYYAGSLISFQSNGRATGERARIELDTNPRGSRHVYAYRLDQSKRDLNMAVVDYSIFDRAMARYEDAVLQLISQPAAPAAPGDSLVVLGSIEEPISLGRSTNDWIEGKLTREQRAFIQCAADKSIRLVGAAGTGKTLSLIVKCLLEFEYRGNTPSGYRSLFLTHSQATVETVTNAIATMDHPGILKRWPASLLKICTLQELANDAMKYDLHGLEPLSSDGLEGRMLQIEAIEAQLEAYRQSDWITRKSGCSTKFRTSIEATRNTHEGRAFAFELMNEFACVLEADGVRQSAERRQKYLTEQRRAWMMSLESVEEREVVLDIYDRFRAFLRDMGAIGVDQMIADYLGFLDSNRWDNVRMREGYDTIFVDELHLFNRQERMTLHHLMRDPGAAPVVIMAYDSKQSPRDTFYGLAEQADGTTVFARDMRLGETERFELSEAFRYTPEIARVLEWIDQTFPAAGLSEELGSDWRKFQVKSAKASGSRPLLAQADRSIQIYRTVFSRAQRAARELGKGRRVGVLCVSEAMFKRFGEAGEYKDAFLAITDREQLGNLRYAGKRFIFSMPEFVAGIQFDTVYLIEVNDGEVPQGPYATGQLRRFVSQTYLGASRAQRILEIYTSKERGGISRVLRHVIDKGAIDVVNIDDLD